MLLHFIWSQILTGIIVCFASGLIRRKILITPACQYAVPVCVVTLRFDAVSDVLWCSTSELASLVLARSPSSHRWLIDFSECRGTSGFRSAERHFGVRSAFKCLGNSSEKARVWLSAAAVRSACNLLGDLMVQFILLCDSVPWRALDAGLYNGPTSGGNLPRCDPKTDSAKFGLA